MSRGRLGVIRDGVELPEEQARALWRAFSDHLETNRDDLDGFARAHGFAAVRAEHRRGRALLLVKSLASMPPLPRASSPPPPRVAAIVAAPTRARGAARKR